MTKNIQFPENRQARSFQYRIELLNEGSKMIGFGDIDIREVIKEEGFKPVDLPVSYPLKGVNNAVLFGIDIVGGRKLVKVYEGGNPIVIVSEQKA